MITLLFEILKKKTTRTAMRRTLLVDLDDDGAKRVRGGKKKGGGVRCVLINCLWTCMDGYPWRFFSCTFCLRACRVGHTGIFSSGTQSGRHLTTYMRIIEGCNHHE